MAIRYSRGSASIGCGPRSPAGTALVMTGAGNGIAAKFIERGGVDLIGVYNTGYFRMQGYGSLAGMLPILDANELVLRTAEREVLPQVQATPVIAGVNGVDPLRDMRLFLEELRRDRHFRRPQFPDRRLVRRRVSPHARGDRARLRARDRACSTPPASSDMLTIGYAFNAEDTTRLMHEAAPDIFIFHAGITGGGATGDAAAASLEDTAARSKTHFDIARADQAGRDPARPRRGDRRARARASTCSTTPAATACSSDRASSAWRSNGRSRRAPRPSRRQSRLPARRDVRCRSCHFAN